MDNLPDNDHNVSTFSGMRWDKLFDDLESQLERELTAEELDLEAEEERLRLGKLSIRDRLAALCATPEAGALRIILTDGVRRSVIPEALGRDWVSGTILDESHQRASCIIPIAAIAGLSLTVDQVATSLAPGRGEEGAGNRLSARLGLPFVLRDLCRRRRPVTLDLRRRSSHGTIDRVGRDHVDLAVHEPGSLRRRSAVSDVVVVPFGEVLAVRF